MAIDASIPLGYQPPQVTSPLDVAKGMMTLQDSMQARQLKQLEISDYLESKQKHEKVQQLAQNKTLFDPQQGWTPEGIANVMAIDSELGGKIQQGQERTSMMQSQLQAAKAQQQDVALKRAKARQDMGLEIANNAASYWNSSEGKPPMERASGYKQTYQQSLQRMKDSGMWEAAGGTEEQFKHDFENPPPPEVAKAFSIKAQQAESKNKYEERDVPLKGDKIQKEFRNSPTETWKPLGASTNKFKPAENTGDAVSPSQSKLHGEEYIATLKSGEQGLIRGIAEGKIDPRSLSTRGGHRERILQQVAQYKPDYNQQDYGQADSAVKAFGQGKQGQSVRAFNVALEHLDTLQELGNSLKNRDTQAINRVANFWKTQTGEPGPTSFEGAKQLVADEVVKAIVGSGGGVHDREEAARTISAASSPTQLVGIIDTYKHLFGGQIKGLEQQYKAQSKRDDFRERFLTEKGREAAGREAFDAPEVKAYKGTGKSLEWTDADEKRLQELEKKHAK